MCVQWRIYVVLAGFLPLAYSGNPDAKRLYDDLLSNYNKLVRPVVNTSDILKVRIKLRLSQLIDVNLKNQIMTTNLWVEQLKHFILVGVGFSCTCYYLEKIYPNIFYEDYTYFPKGSLKNLFLSCIIFWYDYKLTWDPNEYGGVKMLHVPSDHIWRPDIVLYNNADGNFEVTLATKATLYHSGLVEWKPPAIYKSSCEIDVEYFPFDEQTCILKFGSWTYDGFKVDLRHFDEVEGSNVVEVGVDLTAFYFSVEWDILEVPAVRNEKFYTCCDEPYLDITFNITMRRKTLFYTVNLIIPCMGISFLTVLTFYLPSDSGEKVTLAISILISLHVFFLLVVEIIPPTSLVVPLLGKYLIFAMILVSISICVTVVVLNVHFRSPQTHTMAPWVRRVFLHILPRLLVMRRPHYSIDTHRNKWKESVLMIRTTNNSSYHHGDSFWQEESPNEIPPRSQSPLEACLRSRMGDGSSGCRVHGGGYQSHDGSTESWLPDDTLPLPSPLIPKSTIPCSNRSCVQDLHVHRACAGVRFIARHTRIQEDSTKVKEDWKYVAMVLDRLFLWIFTLAVLVGTAGIILQAPSLYDDRVPIDKKYSEISGSRASVRRGPQ